MSLERVLQSCPEQLFRNEEERDTFLRRLRRALKKDIHQGSSQEFLEKGFYLHTEFSVAKIAPLTEGGSKTAAGLLQSVLCCVIGRQALVDQEFETMVTAFAEAYKKNSFIVQWDSSTYPMARTAAAELATDTTRSHDVRGDAYFLLGNLCYPAREFQLGLKHIQTALLFKPEDGYFYASQGCMLAMQMRITQALAALDRAAEVGCDDIEHTLFHRAVLTLKDGNSRGDDAIHMLEQFVDRAEPDARKLPEACYRLAIMHGMQGPRHVGAAKRFFDQAEVADKAQLTAVYQDDVREWRQQARALVKRYQACGNPDCSEAASKLCQRCEQVSYCSRDCQLTHWKAHKKTCGKTNR